MYTQFRTKRKYLFFFKTAEHISPETYSTPSFEDTVICQQGRPRHGPPRNQQVRIQDGPRSRSARDCNCLVWLVVGSIPPCLAMGCLGWAPRCRGSPGTPAPAPPWPIWQSWWRRRGSTPSSPSCCTLSPSKAPASPSRTGTCQLSCVTSWLSSPGS